MDDFTAAGITIPSGTILLGEYGSTSTGVATAASDRDLAGIVVEAPEFITGIARFELKRQSTAGEGNKSSPDDLDVKLLGLQKFASLSAAGNPDATILFYLPRHEILTDLGQLLIDKRDLFLSQHTIKRFLGYLDSQRQALLGKRGARVNRPELVAEMGYDVKFAYHCVRVGYHAHEILDDRKISLPFTGAKLQTLRDIRAGKLTLDEVIAIIDDLDASGRQKLTTTDLPVEVDWAGVNSLLHDLYRTHWTSTSRH